MPAPFLSIAFVSPQITSASSLDLTALTGGANSGELLAGYTGADWSYNFTGTSSKIAKFGAQIGLVRSDFGSVGGPGTNAYCTVSATDAYFDDGFTEPKTLSSTNSCHVTNITSGAIGSGDEYAGVISDQHMRQFIWVGQCVGGTFVATATIGARTPVTLTLTTTQGDCSFIVTHRSPQPTTLDVKILRTVANDAIGQYIYNPAVYVPVPKQIYYPRLV